MKVTLYEVARLAGVSHTTVSNVLNQKGSVSAHTRTKVINAAEALNYERNAVAKSLKTQKSRVIGVVVSDNSNPLFSLVVRGIEELAWQNGYSVILCNTSHDTARESSYIRALYERQVDGIIVSVANEQVEHLDRFFAKRDRPVVFINRHPDRQYGDIVLTDNFRGSRSAVAHLLSLGHRRIGIVGCTPDYVTGRERLAGYLKALNEREVMPDETLIVKATIRNKDQGFAAAMALFNLPSRPTAVLGATYYSTLGALKAISTLGLTIPEEISVIGFDDPDWSDCYNPPLTTVAQPATEMGRVAAEILIERIEKKRVDPFQTIRVSPELRIRSSCLDLSSEDAPEGGGAWETRNQPPFMCVAD